jgi:hypothetical protein
MLLGFHVSSTTTPMPTNSNSQVNEPQADQQSLVPVCIFVSGPRDSGKTRYILECLRKIAGTSHASEGTVAVLLAEEGRTRAESLSAAFPGLILRRLFLPCQCCPELARLPAALRAIRDANPRLERVFIEVPDVAALRFLEEFDEVIGWPRTLVTCLSAAWFKARRLEMLSPFQHALIERADMLLEPDQSGTTQRLHSESTPTVAPFDMTLQ